MRIYHLSKCVSLTFIKDNNYLYTTFNVISNTNHQRNSLRSYFLTINNFFCFRRTSRSDMYTVCPDCHVSWPTQPDLMDSTPVTVFVEHRTSWSSSSDWLSNGNLIKPVGDFSLQTLTAFGYVMYIKSCIHHDIVSWGRAWMRYPYPNTNIEKGPIRNH